MLKYPFLLITLFFVIVTNCFSKDDWQPGYIIKNHGDTIYGLIDNRESISNSKACYFRKDTTSKTQLFYPQDLFGYRFIDGKFFISKKITVLNDTANSSLFKSIEINKKEESDPVKIVFLEFLIQGKVNVYHYRNDLDNLDHYFVEKDGVLSELKNTRETQVVDDKEAITEKKEYIGLLTYVMQDANMQSDILESGLYPESLINIAEKYHNKVCKNEKCIVYEKKTKLTHVVFSAYAGLSYNSIDFYIYSTTNYAPGSLFGCKLEFENMFVWDNNFYMTLGLTLHRFTNYKLTGDKNKASFVEYNNIGYRLENTNIEHWGSIRSLNVNINTLELNMPFIFNYTFSKGKIRPYIGVGALIGCALSSNKEFIYEDQNFQWKDLFHLGLVGQVGCKYKLKSNHSIYIELNLDHTTNTYIRNTILSTNVGYTF